MVEVSLTMITVEWKSNQQEWVSITSHEFKDEKEAKAFVKDNLWMFDHGDSIRFCKVVKSVIKVYSKDEINESD